MCVLGDVFRGEVFVRYCECFGGATIVCDKALTQWYIVCGITRSGMWRGQKWCMNGCREI